MSSNRFATGVDGILERALDGAGSDVQLVAPSRATIPRLVETLGAASEPPRVRLLAEYDSLKAVTTDFLIASKTADLVADDLLAMRVFEDDPESSILVSEDSVTALVYGDEQVAGLVTGDEAFVGDVRSRYDRLWGAAEDYSLRTPPLSRIRETLADEIGPETAADFDAVLSALETAPAERAVDEVTISLLVAARNGELLYDISKWGEDVGLASKATFSRTKSELEERGVIDTEKVPIEVGRPRLRLRLGDPRLRADDRETFGSVVVDVFGE